MPQEFDFAATATADPPRLMPPPTHYLVDFASRFFATFFGVLLAGLILLIGVRFYVAWEVQRAAQSITQGLDNLKKDLASPVKTPKKAP